MAQSPVIEPVRTAGRSGDVASVAPAPRRAGAVAEWGRAASALYFIVMALGVNALYTLHHPETYDGIADLAVLAPYAWLLREVIRPLAFPFTLLLIGFELAVALLMLGKGMAVKVGLLAAILFQLALIPGLGLYGLVNLPVAGLQALLLRPNFDRSVPEVLRGWRPGQ